MLWANFDSLERRDALAGFVERVEVTRGASSDLGGNVRIVWADGTLAEHKERGRVAADAAVPGPAGAPAPAG